MQGNGQRGGQKEKPYLYEKNNGGQGYNNQSYGDNNNRTEKTSVKVHNPPGGRTNFTFG